MGMQAWLPSACADVLGRVKLRGAEWSLTVLDWALRARRLSLPTVTRTSCCPLRGPSGPGVSPQTRQRRNEDKWTPKAVASRPAAVPSLSSSVAVDKTQPPRDAGPSDRGQSGDQKHAASKQGPIDEDSHKLLAAGSDEY